MRKTLLTTPISVLFDSCLTETCLFSLKFSRLSCEIPWNLFWMSLKYSQFHYQAYEKKPPIEVSVWSLFGRLSCLPGPLRHLSYFLLCLLFQIKLYPIDWLLSNCGSRPHQWVMTKFWTVCETDKTDEMMCIRGQMLLGVRGALLLYHNYSHIPLAFINQIAASWTF